MRTPRGALDRLERIGAAATDARMLRTDALDVLRDVVGFDAWVWVTTDPVTAVGVSPVASVPSHGDLPRTVRLKYQCAANRWTDLVSRQPAVGLLSRAVGSASPAPGLDAWRGLLDEFGVGDVASVVFADRFGTWSFLDLWRAGADPYVDGDVEVLARLPGILTTALRACTARTLRVAVPRGRELGPVALVLDEQLRLVGETPAADDWLSLLLPPGPSGRVVPAIAYNVAAQLLAREAGVDRHPAEASGHLADGLWVTTRAARLGDRNPEGPPPGTIVVTIEETSPAVRAEVFGRAHGLTGRERELLAVLGAGADTRGLARTLGISHFTVQDHLASMFAKTGAPTRQVLVAWATGR